MRLTVAASASARKKADILILPFWEVKKKAIPAFKDRQFANLAALPIGTGDFHGKERETLLLYPARGTEKRVLLLGLGNEKALTEELLRRAYATVIKACRRKKYKSLNIVLPEVKMDEALLVHAVSEGLILANYKFDLYLQSEKSDPKDPPVESCCLIGADKSQAKQIEKVEVVTSAVQLTRDLVNANADQINAQMLAETAKQIAKDFKSVKTTVLGKKELEKEKMGLLLAVNRGAAQDPALILIEYRGDPKSKDLTAIVGKGISFDTGGLNLKPTGSIETMKDDMSGAAAVIGTLRAAAELGIKRNIIGVIAAAENAMGPHSFKPGDVYYSHSGKSVEISNTDAEGRLVLADAFSYVQSKYPVTRLIDLATLTGAIVVSLGEELTGLFSNNDRLAEGLMKAGEKTFERLWRMPIYPEYRDALKSPIADMKNSGGRKGGSITAALFLKEFIKGDLPWAHLDIAGTAYLSELNKPYHPLNGTGVGVRLLIEFLEQ
ncbi:MAG: leucyl aminopeptidase [Chlamydiales bacterium]|nr:leucyl aminopeptidase [Chlamydiales bacterium]